MIPMESFPWALRWMHGWIRGFACDFLDELFALKATHCWNINPKYALAIKDILVSCVRHLTSWSWFTVVFVMRCCTFCLDCSDDNLHAFSMGDIVVEFFQGLRLCVCNFRIFFRIETGNTRLSVRLFGFTDCDSWLTKIEHAVEIR